MKVRLYAYAYMNLILPGELGAGYLMRESAPAPVAFTWLGLAAIIGLLFTVNCFITALTLEESE